MYFVVRAPAEFIVIRHRIAHPHESAYQTAKHTGLSNWTVAQVLHRISQENLVVEEQFVERLRAVIVKPEPKELHFRVPNPANWYRSFREDYLVSGDVTASEIDGFPLVPERHLVYVHERDLPHAVQAAMDSLAEVAPALKANLTLRVADRWLLPDDDHPKAVERGQRLLDYAASRQVQLVKGLRLGV